MRKSTKRLLIILVVLLILGGLAFGGWWIWGRDTTQHRIVGFGQGSTRTLGDFSQSLLTLHTNGSFDIEIIERENTIFLAFGSWERSGNTIIFHYVDAWVLSGTLQQDPYGDMIGTYRTFNTSGRRIYFEDPWQQIIHFSR